MRLLAVFFILFSISDLMMASGSMIKKKKKEFYASGKISITSAMEKKAVGLRTMFISLKNSASTRPMPFAAKKIKLSKDPSGDFFSFSLDSQTVMVMSRGYAPPVFDLKFKLDKNGSAGPDESGDIVAVLTGVKKGSKGLSVVFEKAVP